MLSWVDTVPGWNILAAVVVAVALLARRAVRQHLDDLDTEPVDGEDVPVDNPLTVGERAVLAEIAGPGGEPCARQRRPTVP